MTEQSRTAIPESWRIHANALLDAVIEHDDEMGDIANHTPDELRDALRVAGQRLRAANELASATEAHKAYWARVNWGSEQAERRLLTALAAYQNGSSEPVTGSP